MIAITFRGKVHLVFANGKSLRTDKHRVCWCANEIPGDLDNARTFAATIMNDDVKVHQVPDTDEAWSSLLN